MEMEKAKETYRKTVMENFRQNVPQAISHARIFFVCKQVFRVMPGYENYAMDEAKMLEFVIETAVNRRQR